ncbi:uncharacterized protein LOC132934063 isoform X1 [Metopolophium dirhodum]|uniref:uncharacterized protein LOC132934063 isoform X1 n=2 Tax=Metopolophium dirhodum TaxID=44670 RepID=UPI00299042E9|nr:uncharacterized protein LOC132934063 isoform X1 [Metopolophium dirhodum]
MAGEVRFRLTDNLDPLQTLDICHEIVNMTFCSSDRPFTLKKCTKKRCVDRYDSSESSDSGVATFITELGSPLTPDSRVSEYSIPSPDECEPIMAPPPPLANSADEIDLACWPWSEEWAADCSNIELFSDACDTTDYCKTDTNIANIELDQNVIEDDSCNDKLNIFQNSSKINDLFNSLPLAQCKLIESSDIKSECDFVPAKKFLVSDEESPTKFTLRSSDEHFSNDIITSLQSNILDNKCLLKDEESLLSLQFPSCTPSTCSDSFDETDFKLCEDHMDNSISIKYIKDEGEKSICEGLIDTSSTNNFKLNNNISDDESDSSSPHKKLCVDQTIKLPNKGRYFMRSSSGSSHDLFKSKIPHLLNQNKNIQDNFKSSPTRLKCSLRNPINKHQQCDINGSIRNNEQLNYSTTELTSVGFDSNKIRFPKLDSHWISLRGNIMCRWNNCDSHFTATAKLIEHLQVKHVNSQTFSESFVCLWSDCKVFNKPSCSRSWLERHVLSHGGNKPLQCIVQKCRQRFSSQIMLERHVNQHFKSSSNREDEGLNGKLIRRKGKKLRLRRQPFTARKFDYFDQATMMELQNQLFLSTQNSQQDFIDYSRRAIKFQPNVIARRILEGSKTQEVLMRWFPPNILEDEWITCDKKTNFNVIERVVPIMSMSTENRDSITKLFGNIFPPSSRRSRK